MRHCVPCNKSFRSWRLFSRHAMAEHSIHPGNLARRAAQVPDGDLYLIRSDTGRWYMVSQPPLL